MSKIVTLQELRANNTKEKLYLLIHEKGQHTRANHMRSFCLTTYFVQCMMLQNSWTK